MKFPIIEEMAKDVAEKALDEYVYEGKTIRQWVAILKDYDSHKWIPCSERMPENIKTVIVDVKEIEKPTFAWYSNLDECWNLLERDFLNLTDFHVVAWMPLPEPFKAEETPAEEPTEQPEWKDRMMNTFLGKGVV